MRIYTTNASFVKCVTVAVSALAISTVLAQDQTSTSDKVGDGYVHSGPNGQTSYSDRVGDSWVHKGPNGETWYSDMVGDGYVHSGPNGQTSYSDRVGDSWVHTGPLPPGMVSNQRSQEIDSDSKSGWRAPLRRGWTMGRAEGLAAKRRSSKPADVAEIAPREVENGHREATRGHAGAGREIVIDPKTGKPLILGPPPKTPGRTEWYQSGGKLVRRGPSAREISRYRKNLAEWNSKSIRIQLIKQGIDPDSATFATPNPSVPQKAPVDERAKLNKAIAENAAARDKLVLQRRAGEIKTDEFQRELSKLLKEYRSLKKELAQVGNGR